MDNYRQNDAKAIRKIRSFLPYNKRKQQERTHDALGIIVISLGFALLAVILKCIG